MNKYLSVRTPHPKTALSYGSTQTGHHKMLVLALQFSRSHPTTNAISPTPQPDATPEAARMRREGTNPSKRKRRRCPTRPVAQEGPKSLNPHSVDSTDAPVHQQVCVATAPEQTLTYSRQALLRKEVIQPHLPVRLPCYDFTPITDPTFDGSLPKGLGHRLRVLPTFVV